MQISINNLGKKFGSEWIFRDLSYQINANDKLVILGGNGSGKSTLLQMISGFVSPNQGEIVYKLNEVAVEQEKLKDSISFASPYLQLVDDFTLIETIEHSAIFKPFVNKLQIKEIVELIQLDHAKNKFIKQFSSGMKQRLKLGLAILCNSSLLLLDEPVSNLDKEAIQWYKGLLTNYSQNRTIIICSNNVEEEYFLCDKKLNVGEFKIKKW